MHAYTKDMIRKGMLVRLSDGKSLGRVIDVDARSFVMDGGADDVDYVADYDQIAAINGDMIILLPRTETMGRDFEDHKEPWNGEWEDGRRIALEEERLHLERRTRQRSEVRLRKRVITEHKTMTVPVMKEQIRIERVPSSSDTVAKAAFSEATLRIPLEEEEVRVVKRPVVREEVIVRKERVPSEQRVAADVRREELEEEKPRRAPEKGGWRGPGGSENP